MGCDLVRVSAYLDNELSETEREDFETHARECPACAEELQRMRRVIAMSTAYAPPMDLHARVMGRIRQDDVASTRTERMPRRWRVALVAVAASLLAVALGYLWMRGPQQPPSTPMAIHLPQNQEMEQRELAVTPPELAVPDPMKVAQDTQPLEETKPLPFTLAGTVAGGTPTAVLVSTETGKQAVAGIGTEVAPGVFVKEIRQGEVVFDNNGVDQTLTKGAVSTPSAPDMSGVWKVTVKEGGERADEFVAVIKVEGTTITMKPVDEPNAEAVSGTLTGLRFTMARATEVERWDIEGTVAPDGKSMSADAIVTRVDGSEQPTQYTATGEKMDPSALLAAAQREKLKAQIRDEVQAMYPPLKSYAEANNSVMPPSLAALVPDYADEAMYASTPERRITYHAGLSLFDVSLHKEPAYSDTLAVMSQQMLAHEQSLRKAYGRDLPIAPMILEVAYPGEKISATLTVMGGVRVTDESVPSAGPVPQAAQNAMRASDQNNLKQLGLVIKMYQNEHRFECTPPGWLTVYPEYLTDINVLTSPWDEEGTLSYVYFFPARSQNELLEIGAAVSGDPNLVGVDLSTVEIPSAIPKLQSEIPMVADNRDIPGEAEARRNILFLDGHVENMKMEEWETRIAPFIGR
ncbi:MAG: zf-HC2 domain-containing protein [Candidatus Hydrogenedentales bacterium]